MSATVPVAPRVELPDSDYWKQQIRCQHACPVHTDARGYVRAVAEGKLELAYLIARGPNPLASICGRVCGAPCESACRRGDIDRPVAIRALKRFVCESRGLSEGNPAESLQRLLTQHGERYCQGPEELLPLLQSLTSGQVPRVEGKSVGIVGSGPAGLAAAHDLAVLGFAVTIYEMEPVLAGMLATGIPEYRLPRDLIEAEVAAILALGVEARTSCAIGTDLPFSELRCTHDAVIIAVGLKKSRGLDIPGSDAEGILGGVEFLRDVALGTPPPLESRIVVIGGGNVAFDIGRSVLRQSSMDMARSALRSRDVSEVHLCSLESVDEMPADDVEILEGHEEGIQIHASVGPQEILVDESNRVRGVRFHRCLRVFDEHRRFAPIFDREDTHEIPCDQVLLAVGQQCDLSFLEGADDVARTDRGLISVDPHTGRTSVPDVFVAGDLAHGPKMLIHAIASGKAVARSIYEQITGRRLRADDVSLHFPLEGYRREPGYEVIPRVALATRPVAERIRSNDLVIETVLTPEEARREAQRCLDCGVNTIFDGEVCILCGGCVDVCPEQCLEIVSADRLPRSTALGRLLERTLRAAGSEASAIVKDEERCIRCANCVIRCPVQAVTMERFVYTCAWSTVPAETPGKENRGGPEASRAFS